MKNGDLVMCPEPMMGAARFKAWMQVVTKQHETGKEIYAQKAKALVYFARQERIARELSK